MKKSSDFQKVDLNEKRNKSMEDKKKSKKQMKKKEENKNN